MEESKMSKPDVGGTGSEIIFPFFLDTFRFANYKKKKNNKNKYIK